MTGAECAEGRRIHWQDATVFFVVTLITFAASLALVWHLGPIVDENAHARQIGNFMQGNFILSKGLAMGPGYHAVMAALAKIIGVTRGFNSLRLISAGLSVACVLVFYLVARKRGLGRFRAAHLLVLPVLFPYYVLVYTDAFSLLLVLLMFFQHSRKRFGGAAVLAALALCVRQSNIFWVGALWALEYLAECGPILNAPALRRFLGRTYPYLLVFAAFATFVVLNGGIALGGPKTRSLQQVHPSIYNPMFFLFIYALTFLPRLAANRRALLAKARSPWVLLMLAAVTLWWMFQPAMHPWNDSAQYSHLLRNHILAWAISSPLHKVALLAIAGVALVDLAAVELEGDRFGILRLAIVAGVLVAWLVEPRYYAAPFAFLLLLGPTHSAAVERVSFVYMFALSLCVAALGVRFEWVL